MSNNTANDYTPFYGAYYNPQQTKPAESFTRLKLFLALICLSIGFFAPNLQANPVNVNLASSYEIAESLHVPQKVAERISIHCQYYTCREAKDLLPVTGVDQALINKIEKDLIYSVMERGTGYSDDC